MKQLFKSPAAAGKRSILLPGGTGQLNLRTPYNTNSRLRQLSIIILCGALAGTTQAAPAGHRYFNIPHTAEGKYSNLYEHSGALPAAGRMARTEVNMLPAPAATSLSYGSCTLPAAVNIAAASACVDGYITPAGASTLRTPAAAPSLPSGYAARAEVNIRYDSKSGKMSIKATDAPLSDLVSKLETAYSIRLFVLEVSMDTKVTCNVQDKFIDDALREALPANTRFFYRFTNGNAELEDRKPAARQLRAGTTAAATTLKAQLKAQPAATAIKPGDVAVTEKRIARTTTATLTRAPLTAAAMPLKLSAASIRPQQLVQQSALQQPDDYYVKVVVKVTPNGYEPVSYTKVKGNLVNDNDASGEFVYQLKDAGREVYSGAFEDPLELHSYSPSGNHKILQAKETYISVSLPRQVLDKNAIKVPTLEFSKVRGEALQDNRSIKMLQPAALQRKGLISTEALQKVIPRR